MKWPAQSPDLNPKENLWDKIATIVVKGNPYNNAQLLTDVKAAWDNSPDLNITNLTENMLRRCQAVIDAHGQVYVN